MAGGEHPEFVCYCCITEQISILPWFYYISPLRTAASRPNTTSLLHSSPFSWSGTDLPDKEETWWPVHPCTYCQSPSPRSSQLRPPSSQLGPGSDGSSHHWVVLLQLRELLLALPQGGQKPPQLRKFKTSSHWLVEHNLRQVLTHSTLLKSADLWHTDLILREVKLLLQSTFKFLSCSSLDFQSEGKNHTLFIYETVTNYSVS